MGEPAREMTPSTFWKMAFAQNAERDERWRDHAAEEAFWRHYAPNYDERSPLAQRADALIVDLLPLLGPGDRVLEIGAGSGSFTRRIADHVGEISAVEPSTAMRIEFLRRWEAARSDAPPGSGPAAGKMLRS